METNLFILLGSGVALAILGWVWLLVRGFSVSRGWGWSLLVPLSAPFAFPLFVIFHTRAARKPLLVFLLAGLCLGAPFAITAYHRHFANFGPRERMVEGQLHITLTGWDQDDYARLRLRPEVVVLQMANPDVTDATLDVLREATQLEELDLNDTQVTDKGLAILAELPALKVLRLARTKVTEEGFQQHLADRESLLQLDLSGTSVASKSLRAWKAARPERKYLR